MIKAVLFDYGGVMSNGGRGTELITHMAEKLGVSEERARELLNVAWMPYASGMISEDELWYQIEAAYGRAIPVEKRAIWNQWDIMRPFPEMVAFVGDLKKRGYRVGLLSNVIPNTAEQIRLQGGYELFDPLILSCEAGCSKPQREIYELALGGLPGVEASEVLFIDDQERFLVLARELGIQTLLAQSPGQVIADVNQLIKK